MVLASTVSSFPGVFCGLAGPRFMCILSVDSLQVENFMASPLSTVNRPALMKAQVWGGLEDER